MLKLILNKTKLYVRNSPYFEIYSNNWLPDLRADQLIYFFNLPINL